MNNIVTRQALVKYGQPLEELTEELPIPEGTEVLIKIRHCGVCHSDLHMQDGYFDNGGGKKQSVAGLHKLPHTLGHEMEGEVIALGTDAEGINIGDRRAVYPWTGCRRCSNCQKELEHLCNAPRSLGVTRAGGFATHVKVPHPRYLLDYTGISANVAGSMMCSGLTAYGALKKWLPRVSGSTKLIIGLGGVGMMALRFAKLMYDKPPIIAEIDPEKRKQALELGALDAFDLSEPGSMKDILRKHGWLDAVVDFVGNEKTVTSSLRLINKGGKIVIVGLYGGELKYPLPMLAQREVAVEGSYVCSLSEAKEMLDFVRTKEGFDNINISTRPVKEANAALDDLRAGRVNGRIVLTG